MSDPRPHRRIRAQGSPRDPHVMRFLLDMPVQEGRARTFHAPDPDAPLATALFAVNGIAKVQVTGETILVNLAPGHDWENLKRPVAAAIREVLDSFDLPLGDEPEQSGAEIDAALLAEVNEALDQQANPSIARHGGRVTAERAEDGIVYLRMSGGCQGCAASTLTLRGGVERILRASVPGIREIVDVTDHGAGSNPFYQNMPGAENTISPLEKGAADKAQPQERGPDQTADLEAVSHATTAELAEHIRAHLGSLSPRDVPVSYGSIARTLGLYRPGSIRRVTDALELMMHQDAAAGRPLLAARAVSRGSGDLPGRGFFDLAAELGRGPLPPESWADFHRREMEATFRPEKPATGAREAG